MKCTQSTETIDMKRFGKSIPLAIVAICILVGGIAGCASTAPVKTAELRDYPGQSFYCYLHKTDAGC